MQILDIIEDSVPVYCKVSLPPKAVRNAYNNSQILLKFKFFKITNSPKNDQNNSATNFS